MKSNLGRTYGSDFNPMLYEKSDFPTPIQETESQNERASMIYT